MYVLKIVWLPFAFNEFEFGQNIPRFNWSVFNDNMIHFRIIQIDC